MITNYYNFIFEVYSAEQSKEKADEFIVSIYKRRAEAIKKASIKRREMEIGETPISNEEWIAIKADIDKLKAEKKQDEINAITDPKYLRVIQISDIINTEGKLTDDEIADITEKAKNDPFYLRLKELTKNDPEMIDYFIRLFYRDYKNFNINLDNTADNNNYQEVRNALGPFTYNKTDDEIIWNTSNNYGLFGSVLDRFKKLDKSIQDKILNNFDKYKKLQEIELKKSERVPGIDMMSNDVRDLQIDTYTDLLLERLPTGVKDKDGKYIAPNLLEEYRQLKNSDPLKIKIKDVLSKLVSILLNNGVSFESKREELKDRDGKVIKDKSGNPVYTKIFPQVEKQFKMRKGTQNDPQEDKSLEDFITRVKSKIQGLSNVGVDKLYELVDETNEKFGKENGAEVVFVNDKESDKPIIVIRVKSAKANWYLHNNNNRKQIKVTDEETGETRNEWNSGRLSPTGHCIAWPIGSNMWNTYMTDSRKLYYVYNFGLDVTDNRFPFGVIVEEDGNITSAHAKDDTSISFQVKSIIEGWGLDFDTIFIGLTPEEKEIRYKKMNSSKRIQQKGISLEDFKECLEYADPNIGGGIPLLNSVEEPNLEKVKLLASKNADFNEPSNILRILVSRYIASKNRVYDEIVTELLKERIANIGGVTKNLGHNPIPTLKIFSNEEYRTELEYLLSKKINFEVYDPTSTILESVSKIEDILLLLNYGVRINASSNEEHVYEILFPKKIVDSSFINMSKQILNKIPAKKDLREYDIAVHSIFEYALYWSVKSNNFEYFKMILDISKARLDAGENDFIEEFLDKSVKMPDNFKNYLKSKLDDIYD